MGQKPRKRKCRRGERMDIHDQLSFIGSFSESLDAVFDRAVNARDNAQASIDEIQTIKQELRSLQLEVLRNHKKESDARQA